MTNEAYFPIQSSLLSETALAEKISARYSLPAPPSCRFWSRSINDTYLIEAGKAKYFLRVSPTGWRSHEHLTAEIELLDFLQRHSFPVPQPIRQKDGTCILTLNAPEGTRYGAVFGCAPGRAISPLTAPYSYRYGQAIARLHALTDDYPSDRAHHQFSLENLIDEPLTRLKPLFDQHRDDFAFLEKISNDLKQVAAALPAASPYYGICHGDVHSNNIHFDGKQGWTLIDFEYAGYGWRVLDISNIILTQVNVMDRTDQTKNIRAAFLDGYQSVRPLSAPELDVIPAFVILRQIWMLGITARLAPNLGLDMVNDWVFNRCMPFIRAWTEAPW